jgi:hypothetical protein
MLASSEFNRTYHCEESFACTLVEVLSLLEGVSFTLSKCHVDIDDTTCNMFP